LYPGILRPTGLTVGPDGNLWFTNSGNRAIGRMTPSGQVTMYTGHGIDNPDGITVGPHGALWFTFITNNDIGRFTTAGQLTECKDGIGSISTAGTFSLSTNPYFASATSIARGPDGGMWFTTRDNVIGRVPTGLDGMVAAVT
jgi:streptogramin lyase